jgi:RimJ/RimL family protein N-acetyltransferase
MIELQFFERTDFKQLINWIDSPEFLLQFSGPKFDFPLTERQLEDYIKGANTDDSSTLIYKVIHEETGNIIGHISLGEIDKKNLSARVGKLLIGDKSMRGLGIGEMMVEKVLEIAFKKLKLHRVSLSVFDFNHSAIFCYEKVGFVKEGLYRDYRKMGDEYWNTWGMSILESEWFTRSNRKEGSSAKI